MRRAISLIFGTALAAAVFAQQGNGKSETRTWLVPPVVENKLRVEHPGAEPRWKKEDNCYRAEFISPLNNLGYVLVYDSTGKVVRRDRELENSDYPGVINDYLRNKFAGEGYSVWSSTDTSGNVGYFSPRADKLVRFDKNGRPLDNVKVRSAVSDSVIRPVAK